ncbi:hypothetical protein [Allosalinactinospora lopnorensis]|uniref:hypothetical protein n=1 Tax=Allosalinactinospora lopnorensis TaxID=1352348 RepID=UPI000623D13B|nr:hypothetical protein [Allosalinactinospora lopnorensis]
MVNKRMKARAVLSLARMAARANNLKVEELKGRGKGSHHVYVIRGANGGEVGRFSLTDHSKEVSWTVLRSIDDGLVHLFGEKWLEKR